MKKQEIVSVLCELHKITGFRVSLHGADYSEIAAYPEKKADFCMAIHGVSDEYRKCVDFDKAACKRALEKKDTHIYTCRYGLTEAVSPLYNFGTLTGFLMMGQVIEEGMPRERLSEALKSFGYSSESCKHLPEVIPSVKGDMIGSFVKIMTICAQYLTLSNAIPTEKPTIAQMTKKYVYDNFKNKFGIKDMCKEIGCSKSTLITSFKREFGKTVNNYVNEVRLNEAAKMLTTGEYNIGVIALECGFSDQSYFSKVFSSKFGMPPSQYGKAKE